MPWEISWRKCVQCREEHRALDTTISSSRVAVRCLRNARLSWAIEAQTPVQRTKENPSAEGFSKWPCVAWTIVYVLRHSDGTNLKLPEEVMHVQIIFPSV
jgi:hypothetical protein